LTGRVRPFAAKVRFNVQRQQMANKLSFKM
jgi:hypothetical protein